MHTEYEAQEQYDWKKHDHTDHEAGAAYYDEVAQTQSSVTPPPAAPETPDTYHLEMAREHMENYTQVSSERYYHLAMMHAAIATAEAQTRQAEVAESMLEFAAELIGKTDIVSALLQWGYNQRKVG